LNLIFDGPSNEEAADSGRPFDGAGVVERDMLARFQSHHVEQVRQRIETRRAGFLG
jgi:hypothetical protein